MRLAVAGVIVAAPLAVLAVPAQAETAATPAATEVAHPRGGHHGHGNWDRRGDRGRHGNWDRHRGWDRHDRGPWDRGWNGFRHMVPPGAFGSS